MELRLQRPVLASKHNIRYGKAKGGLVGITLNPDQVAGWVVSYHICNTVALAMDDIFDKRAVKREDPM